MPDAGGHDPNKFFELAVRKMRLDFEQLDFLDAGQVGSAREDVVRSFLRQYLPKRFAAENGFAYNFRGEVSAEQDILVYDESSAPVIRVTEDVPMVPVESILATIQVKTRLDLRAVKSAVENLVSVPWLPASDYSEKDKPVIKYVVSHPAVDAEYISRFEQKNPGHNESGDP